MRAIELVRKNYLYIFLLTIIVIVAFFIRLHNLFLYNTWWADDGGAHLAYLMTILEHYRLPTMADTYVAYHEPIYYVILAVWTRIGDFFAFNFLNWVEGLSIIIYAWFLFLVWKLTYTYSKNKWIALLNLFLFSFIFIGVKLSAYATNELLAQTLIVLTILLFLNFKLLEENKYKQIIFWAVILSIATLVKITAFIILLSAFIIWMASYLKHKKLHYLGYVFLTILVVAVFNAPWFIYKQQHFGNAFSINLYEEHTKQNILNSDAWGYIFAINKHVFTDYPYWFSKPASFTSIVISDTFGDYYNLFNNVDRIENLATSEKLFVGNGRYVTLDSFVAMIRVNKIGFVISSIWLIGFIIFLLKRIRERKIDWYELFILITLLGGFSALLYNNLRLPYLERGVLKGHFILFTFPILAMIAYTALWNVLKNKWLWATITFLPIIVYVFLAWPVIYLR